MLLYPSNRTFHTWSVSEKFPDWCHKKARQYLKPKLRRFLSCVGLCVYKEIMRRLLHSMCEKRRELWQENLGLCLYGNAVSIWQFLAGKNIHIQEQPPYSGDLSLSDLSIFFPLSSLFPKLSGIRFEDMVKMAAPIELWVILEEFVQDCLQVWQRSLGKVC